MKPRMVSAFISCLTLIAVAITAKPLPKQNSAHPAYSNSTDGLQKLVWDMVAAEKGGGEKALTAYLQALALPDAPEWFSAAFGEGNGQQLAVFYDAWTGPRNSQIAGDVARAIALNMNDVAALSFNRPGDPGATDRDNYLLGLLKQNQTLYVVNFKSEDGATMSWAYFVYDAGTFRYLGPLADVRLASMRMAAPTTAAASPDMPKRVRMPGDLAQTRIVHRVLPVYPQEAVAQRLEGAVELHVIIAPDGSVQSLEATSGNPALVGAAETAVRQWRFQPMLLNGEAMTVDTTITVDFHLPHTSDSPAGPGGANAFPPIPSYPDSPGGLTKMMKQMLDLSSRGKNSDLNSYYHALLLPNSDVWFSTEFGDRDGTRFAENYQRMEQSLPMLFANVLQTDTGLKYDTVDVIRFKDACSADANETEYPILAAREQQNTALYEVRFLKNGGFRWLFPFAYVNGGFRYLGNLGIEAPPNTFLSNNIQPPKLIKEVQAVYPMGINMPGNTGNVKLWGIIGADGSVRDLHVIRGTCPYVKATIEAVKKWKYQPLLVDGKPQDMIYPFEYNFGLNR